ncbi:MAG: transposase [Ignavibacteria bacterium]|nr:transposase [Ignavibacteria bacterium]
MRSRYKILNEEGIHFITSTIVDWIEIFTNEDYFKILIESINYSISEKNLKVFAYVLMKNHFHIICKAEQLSNVIRSIKSYSAKIIIEKLEEDKRYDLLEKFKLKNDNRYQIWQEGFHPKEIINNEEFKQKIEYIHNNPVNENYCVSPTDWKYSSANFYENEQQTVIKVERIV